MPRFMFQSRPPGVVSKRFTSARVAAQSQVARYRRTCFEQLEERRALATVTLAGEPITQFNDGIPLAHFDAAVFPRLIHLKTDVDLAPAESRSSAADLVSPLLLTRQQDPVRVLPLANSRSVASSIDRIQATPSVETNVELRQGPLNGPSQHALLSKREIVTESSPGRAPASGVNSSVRSTAVPPSRAGEKAASWPSPADEKSKNTMPDQDTHPSDFLLQSPSRSNASAQPAPATDGREYLTGVQTIVLTAAAVATALVLPGIVSEFRRRRKSALLQIARESQRPTELDKLLKDRAATTLPIRERAG